MFPKVGDVVKLNPDFLKVWFKRGNKYFENEVLEKILTVTEVQDLENFFIILFESKDYDYYLHILSNGESVLSDHFYEYKNIQVFIPANISETKKDDIYCSCGGSKKENWVFGERFYICTVCKKEAI